MKQTKDSVLSPPVLRKPKSEKTNGKRRVKEVVSLTVNAPLPDGGSHQSCGGRGPGLLRLDLPCMRPDHYDFVRLRETRPVGPIRKNQRIHNLKILSEYFDAVGTGIKTFEYRLNDRNYGVGDWLLLNEFDGLRMTGRVLLAVISYVLESTMTLPPQYVILGIKVLE